ncbi:DUF4184 family protein [Nocardia noduli]|uniref:DUF4184 family protein n=1 Tax=Nocardia noduli TaxID=2815722 RepID=UPI001C220E6F|nr:DUF4184 family protein [Nocardia noduli]
MPFTLAHPAAALLLRRHLPFPALVAGTMAPDVVYYLPLSLPVRTHATAALPGWDLLFGFALLAIFRLTANPLLALAPSGLRRRIPAFDSGFRSVGEWVTAAVAIVVGAATHLAWDAFTQTDGAAVRQWAWLRVSVVEPHKLYNVIGYASSIGGMVLVGVVAVRWYRRAPVIRAVDPTPTWWSLALPMIVVFAIICGVAVVGGGHDSGYDAVRAGLIGAVRGCVVAVALYAAAWRLAARPVNRFRTGGRAADRAGVPFPRSRNRRR